MKIHARMEYFGVMSIGAYFAESGFGEFADCYVRDLLPPSNSQIESLLVLESPHRSEFETGVPLSGPAGRCALDALTCAPQPQSSLGEVIAKRHAAGDTRFAIMNVSVVPLQLDAHRYTPRLSSVDNLNWKVIQQCRDSTAQSIESIRDAAVRAGSRQLLDAFQARVAQLDLSVDASIYVAGRFAQRFWGLLTEPPSVSAYLLPHPARQQWKRLTPKDSREVLNLLRNDFERHRFFAEQ